MSAGLFVTLALQCVFNRLDLALGNCNLAFPIAPSPRTSRTDQLAVRLGRLIFQMFLRSRGRPTIRDIPLQFFISSSPTVIAIARPALKPRSRKGRKTPSDPLLADVFPPPPTFRKPLSVMMPLTRG